MAIKFLIWILSCSSVYGAMGPSPTETTQTMTTATDETQDAARIESFHYQTVNPGALSEVNCTVSGNPLPEESDVVLTVGASSVEISSSNSTDDGGSITYYWYRQLDDDVVIYCKIIGQPNATQEKTVSLYTLPSYKSEPVLTFSRVTPTSMNVSWPAWEEGKDPGHGPIKAYKLYRRNFTDGPFDVLNEGEALSYYVENLEPSTGYFFQLAVVRDGENGEGQLSTQQQHMTCSAPGKVINRTANAQEQWSLTVSWAPPSMANNACQIDKYIIVYRLLRHKACDQSEDASVGKIVEESGTEVTLVDLEEFARYEIRVSAVINGDAPSQNLQGPFSNVIARTLSSAPSGQVTRLRSYRPQQHSLSFAWNSLSCEDHNGETLVYQLELMQRNRNEAISVVQRVNTSRISKTFHGLKACGDYKLKVTPSNSQYSGTATESSEFATTSEAEPGKVIRLTANAQEQRTLTVTWEPPSMANNACQIDKYIIVYRRLQHKACDPGEDASAEETVEESGTRRRLDGLEEFANYEISVSAVINGDAPSQILQGPFSNVTQSTLPSAPSRRVTSLQNILVNTSAHSLSFTWDSLPCEVHNGETFVYQVELMQRNRNRATSVVQREETPGTSITFNNLKACGDYKLKVTPRNSQYSGTATESSGFATTSEAAPGEVIRLTANAQEQRSLTVTWAPPSMANNACQIDKYIIVYRRLQHKACDPGEDASAEETVEESGTEVTLVDLKEFAIYEIRVSAVILGDASSQNLQGLSSKDTESTLPSAPSRRVTSLRNILLNTSPHSLSFTWDSLPCEDHNGDTLVYQLELEQRNRNRATSVVQREETPGTNITFNNLKACGDYQLKVTPRNSQYSGTATESGFATTSEADLGKVRTVTTTLSGNDIIVNWQAPDDANNLCAVNSYKLMYALQRYRACEQGVPNVEYLVIEDIPADVNRYTLRDLQPYSTYRIQMVAKHHDTFGQLSETAYVTTDKQNPAAVRSVRVDESFSTSRELQFTWDPISCKNLSGDFLRYRYGGNGTSGVKYLPNQDADRVRLTALNPCTVYQFQIRVVNDVGAGPFSTTTGRTEEEAPGSDFNLRLTSVGPRSLKAVWQRPHSHPCTITGQRIIIRLREDVCGNSSGGRAESISTGIWEKTFEDLLPYSKYIVGIRASNSEGYGDWNYTAERTEEEDPSGPPEEVGLKQKTSTMLKFGWKKPACGSRNGVITGYEYTFRNSAKPDQDVRTEFDDSSRTKAFTNLIPYTTYTLQVRARTKTGFGPYSDPITNTTDEDIPPAPDTPESVSSNTSTIQISWRAPNPPHGVILGYDISYNTGEETSDVVVSGPEEPLTVFITNLRPDSIYSVRVSARTRVGLGDWSLPLLKETKEDVPGEPSTVSVINQTKHSLEISWKVPKKPNGKITKYKIRVLAVKRPYITGFTEEDAEDVFNIDATSDRLTYNITDLDPSTDYKLTVTAHTSAGEGEGVVVIGKTELFTDLDRISPEQMEKIASSIRRGESEAVFTLPALRQYYATGYFINITTLSKSKRSAAVLDTYRSNQKEYVAAEIAKSSDDTVFTVGDGKNYSDYYNAPLQKDREYNMSIGVCSKTDEDVKVTWSSEVEISAYRSGNAVLIIILLLILFCCVCVLVAAAFLYKRWKQTKEEEEKEVYARAAREQRDKPDIVVLQNGSPEELELQNSNKKNQRGQKPAVPKKPKNPGKTVKIAELSAYIKKKKASETDNFLLEYEALPDNILFPCQVAEKPQNKRKNRYGNIIPYDSSRVVLETLEGDPHSDYINASYIDGFNYPTKYIASHGPNTASVKDFWRMIWQEDVGKIVMLTNVVEMGKKKCEKYWPDEALKYNNVIVTLVTEKKLAAYTIRTFNLQSLEVEDVVKTVTHYHFTAWPDMKVPDFAGPILELLQVVRSDDNQQSGPMVVHCSAGVGRTGTYITLDAMLDMADAEGKINVFGFVTQMRENRIKMVQIAEQYQFIFDALLEHFIIGKTSIETANLRTELSRLKEMNMETGRSYLQDQFETLQLISVTPPDGKLKGGKIRENYSKNRYPGRIPVDTYRPYLMTDVGAKGNNYINATFLSGYSKKDMFLGTQMPLPNTVLDFWRMIWDYNSYVIVMLNDMDDKSMAQYWSEPGTFDCGPFTVTQLSCEDQNGVRYRKLELVNSSQSNENPRIIMHLQCLDWPNSEETPRSLQTMLYAITMISEWESETDLGPITVHCIDGIGRTGIFCALLSALDQTKSEDKVDIFQLVNKLRTSRPTMVENYLQYQCIFDSVQSHLEDPDDSNIYENYSR